MIGPGYDGDPTADLYVIGRDFGATEAATGIPFVGRAGQILNAGLRAGGFYITFELQEIAGRRVERRTKGVYIDNVVRRQPPNNDWARHSQDDINKGVAAVQTDIARRQPKLIIALGNEAFRVCMYKRSDDETSLPKIQQARGFLWDSPLGPRVLASVHPAGMDRQWLPWRVLFDVDMRKGKRELDLGCPDFPEREVTVVAQPWHLQELKNAVGAAGGQHSGGLVALDIEGDLNIRCVGFAPSIDHAWVIPFEQGWQRQAIKDLCESRLPWVLANGKYDRFCLSHNDIELDRQAFDVQLAWHALNPEIAGKREKPTGKKKGYSRHTQKSLRFLDSIYTRNQFYKDYSFEDDAAMYHLCGLDCCSTLEIALKQEKELAA